MNKKLLASAMAVVMTASMGAIGCGKSEKDTKSAANMTDAKAVTTAAKQVESGKLKKWPKPVTLTWYVRGDEDEYYQHLFGDMESMKAIEKATNIKIKFQVATNDDSYLPMMTSGDYPDIITAKNMERYPGRLPAMYKDGVSIKLNDLIDKYMPNFKGILDKYPDIAKDLRLDSGEYTFFSQLFDTSQEKDREAKSIGGLALRKDWLDAIGKDVPTTMDEWHDVLSAFKTQDPNGNGQQDEEPVCFASSCYKYFLAGYGITEDPTLDASGKVTFGMASDGYKQFLTEMHKWYSEGLIYNIYDKTSLDDREEAVTNNLAGAWKADAKHFDENDSYLSELRAKVPEAEFVAAPFPKAAADGKQYTNSDIASFSRDTTMITSKCKNAEAAAFLIDYMYSKEGSTLLNWGIKGKSYEEKDGTKKVKSGMDKEMDYHGSKVPTMYKYADSSIVNFPSFGQYSDYVQSTQTKGYLDATKIWAKGETFKLPYPVQLSPDDQAAVDSATEGMDTYMAQMQAKFIRGEEPLTNYDSYVDQLKQMGLDTLVSTWQKCYDAYQAR